MPQEVIPGTCPMCRQHFASLLVHLNGQRHAEEFWTTEMLAGVGLLACSACGQAIKNEFGLFLHLKSFCKANQSTSHHAQGSSASAANSSRDKVQSWSRGAPNSSSGSPAGETVASAAASGSQPRYLLELPRSDGRLEMHPTVLTANPNGWYEKLPESSRAFQAWMQGIGQRVAALVERSDPKLHTAKLPKNYAVYAYRQTDDVAMGRRTRAELFGCSNGAKFRSVSEFLPHVDWLMNLDNDLNNHSTCKCKGRWRPGMIRGTAGRATPTESRPLKRPSVFLQTSSMLPEPPAKMPRGMIDADIIDPQRVVDLKHQDDRPIRKGELAWLRVSAVTSTEPRLTLPKITHWPVLVTGMYYVTRSLPYPPDDPNVGKVRVVRDHSYTLHPLGYFDMKETLYGHLADMLPWKAGEELMGGSGETGWSRYVALGQHIMQKTSAAAGACDDGSEEAIKKWHGLWSACPPLAEVLQREWRFLAVRMGVAVRQALALSDGYCLTDKVEPSEEWLSDPETGKWTEYQGLYWAGERIWVDDIVRINPRRIDSGGMPEQHYKTEGKAILMRIFVIAVQIPDEIPRSIDRINWNVKLSGDLLTLQPCVRTEELDLAAEPDDERPAPHEVHSGIRADYSFPKLWPPKGYMYKRLNPPGTQATIDLSDVVGRPYPTLLDSHQFTRTDSDHKPIQSALRSLVGLTSGAVSKPPKHFSPNLAELFRMRMENIEVFYFDRTRRKVDSSGASIITTPSQVSRQ